MPTTVIDSRLTVGTRGKIHVHSRFTANEPRPTVVLSHGFTVDGTESHRIFLRMAGRYNALGINTINFDYYGAGYSDGDYSEFSLTNAIEDLNTLLDWAKSQPSIDPRSLIIHGQSLGSAVATVVGSDRTDLIGCVMWNLSADLFRRYSAMLGDDIFAKGETWIRDKGFLIKRSFMEDIQKYDVLSYFDRWRHPTLFVSSGADTTGEPHLAEVACEKIGTHGTRVVIGGANHSFKCQPELERQAAEVTTDWVRRLIADHG